MDKNGVIFLFIIGFLLWYINRTKQVVAVAPVISSPNRIGATTVVGSSQNLVAVAPITALGFSWATTHEMSFWTQAGFLPNVTLYIPGSNVSGDSWQLGVSGPSIVQINGIWTAVRRFNPTTLNVGGVGPNTTCYAVISNPDTGASITVQFTTPAATTPAIVNIPMVPVALPTMVGGVPSWLVNLGVSYDATKPDASFWLKSTLRPTVKVARADGTPITGVAGFAPNGMLPDATTNDIWNWVLRFNASTVGTPGVSAGIYLITITNPANAAETVTIATTPTSVPALTINQVALVPYVADNGNNVGGSSADLDTYLGVQPVASGTVLTWDAKPDLLRLGMKLVNGYVIPVDLSGYVAPAGYKKVYQVDTGQYVTNLDNATPSERGDFVLVTLLVVIVGANTNDEIRTQLNQFTQPVQSIGVMY